MIINKLAALKTNKAGTERTISSLTLELEENKIRLSTLTKQIEELETFLGETND